MRRLITYITLVCFIATQTLAIAGPHDEGLAAGQAAIPVVKGSINSSAASGVVPGYTSTAPETAFYGIPSLGSQGNARLAACASTPTDPVCEGQTGAANSAMMPRPAISPYDPSVTAARDIVNNPTGTLGSLSSYYSSCATTNVAQPPGLVNKLCNRYVSVGNIKCSKRLDVDVTRTLSCKAGDWYAQIQIARNSADHMDARTMCNPNPNGTQVFGVYAAGGLGACSGWQSFILDPAISTVVPVKVAGLAPHWGGACWTGFAAYYSDNSCIGNNCNVTFHFAMEKTSTVDSAGNAITQTPFLPSYGACPTGEVSGGALQFTNLSTGVVSAGNASDCFRPVVVDTITGLLPAGSVSAVVTSTGMPGNFLGTGNPPTVGYTKTPGYPIWSGVLSFKKPHGQVATTDSWFDQCAPYDTAVTSGSCSLTTPAMCVDGPSTKRISGIGVTRACWDYQKTYTCSNGPALNECTPLAAQGCTSTSSVCRQTDPATGLCQIFQDTYQCPAPAKTATQVTTCPGNTFCVGAGCFNTAHPNDPDFARSMAMMEAAREAGVYIDPNNLEIFKGYSGSCRDMLFNNCCSTNSAGKGMSNQSVMGKGSSFVYDTLFNMDNMQFVYQGMAALVSGAGFSGSFTSYGITVAVNGAALPSSSIVLYSSGTAAGASSGAVVVAVDPWTLAIAVIIYVVMTLMTCDDKENILAMKKGANLCHDVGTYCSSKILGACIENTTSSCCFNSMLSRIVNEQGRVQIGKGWGGASNPDCSGFSVTQIQSLDFAAMDLSAVYAAIVPQMLNVGNAQTTNAARVPTCYYGQGKCQ